LVYAVAVAVSPVPIGAILLLLTCPRRGANGLSFLAGWVLGVGTLAVLFVTLVHAAGISDADPLWLAVPEIVVGIVFLLAAVALWIRRDRRRAAARLPGSTPSTA
jgi:Sap, sulfolipid-1-addressing protein